MRALILVFLVFLAGCVTTNSPQMCPPEDVVISVTTGNGNVIPVRVEAGAFDGDYVTVDEYLEMVEKRGGNVRFQPK